MLSPDIIESNWKKFENLCGRLKDKNLSSLLDEMGERIVMCPLSMKRDQQGCYPGGLVENSLSVTLVMKTLNETFDMNLDTTSIIRVGLLHSLGKIGDLTGHSFIDQDSDWHREKLGQYYKFNEDIAKMSMSHRTLYLLQHFDVKLSREEWIAIQLSQGSHFEENRFYVGHEPTIALALQQARNIVNHIEK
ncbi:hypothetical protein CMI47_08170 [Candidatus Pacearchaeota archaeon]|nr:hypothetical protein [Candidatus Pacearchaeota archaeon]|tara:strand:- start:566 stop:1138 length:573 start_codon:yes stop_codon:yes gene_type:complete